MKRPWETSPELKTSFSGSKTCISIGYDWMVTEIIKGKIWVPLGVGRVPEIYTNIYHVYMDLYNGCLWQYGVIFGEQLLVT